MCEWAGRTLTFVLHSGQWFCGMMAEPPNLMVCPWASAKVHGSVKITRAAAIRLSFIYSSEMGDIA